MMTETQQFLEQLKDPFRFGIRKACFDFHNDPLYHHLIYDLRIQQINEQQYYNIVLITRELHHQITLCDPFMDLLGEYVPDHIKLSYNVSDDLQDGKYQRIFYAWDDSTVHTFK